METPVAWDAPPARPALADDHVHVWRCASRAFVRQRLAAYLDAAPEALRFATRPGGKPFLAAPTSGLEFNLTHSGDLVLLAVASHPIGIDVERIRPVPHCLAVARRVLPAEDVAELEMGDRPESPVALRFLDLWTRFEAKQKAIGQGVFGERPAHGQLVVRSFRPDEAYVAALAWAAATPVREIAFFSRQ
jgi:4'-phosphopantetheinyl transferase